MTAGKKHHRILLIEDDPLNTEMATDMLQFLGYEVLKTANAEDGIQLAHSANPDLILIDIGLRGVSGIDVISALRGDERLKDLPIVAWSAFVHDEHRQRAFAAGCDGYLTKPTSMAEFTAGIHRFLIPRKSM